MKYEYRKACRCGNIDFIEVTKTEAAFNLREKEICKVKCTMCGLQDVISFSVNMPEIDSELVGIWANNPEYRFCEQDEELILAQYEENIDLYLKYIDKESVDESIKNV